MSAIEETFKAIMDRIEHAEKAAKTKAVESRDELHAAHWRGYIEGIRKSETIIAAERAMLPEREKRKPEIESGNEVRKPEAVGGSFTRTCHGCGYTWDGMGDEGCPICG